MQFVRRETPPSVRTRPVPAESLLPVVIAKGASSFLSQFDIPDYWSVGRDGSHTVFRFHYISADEKLAAHRFSGAEIEAGDRSSRIHKVRVPSGLMPADTAAAAIEAVKSWREKNPFPEARSHSDIAVRRILGDRNI